MLTFDKLKLVTNINDIEVLDTSLFNITYKNDVMASMKFYQLPKNLQCSTILSRLTTYLYIGADILTSGIYERIQKTIS